VSKAELIVQIEIVPNHQYSSLWASMNEAGVVSLLQDQVYLRADGYVNTISRHPNSIYTMLAGVSPDAYRLFRWDDETFIKEIFGQDLDKDFGVREISVYEAA
jgi:hypothetical protein